VKGSIGVNEVGAHFNIGKGVSMPDDTVVMGDSVRIGEGSNVFRVEANQLFAQPGTIIRGGSGPALLPAVSPFCSIPSVPCGGPDVGLEVNQDSPPLPPGSYGTVLVRNGGTLKLAPGTFNFCRLLVGRGGSVETEGAVTINVNGPVRLGSEASLAPVAQSPHVILNVAGSQIRFGQNSVVQAVVTAPRALLRLGRSSMFDGSFCVDMLRDDKHITLECSCSAP
jgi:hypothetical protein